jgi:hypothetical protein
MNAVRFRHPRKQPPEPSDGDRVHRLLLDQSIVLFTSQQPVLDIHDRHVILRLLLPSDRHSHAVRHVLAREILGFYLTVEQHRFRIVQTCCQCGADDQGKPFLTQSNLCTSMSSRGCWALLAVAEHNVRIDVETTTTDLSNIISSFLRSLEFEQWHWAFASSDRTSTLVRLWCRKEALIRITGQDIYLDLSTIGIWNPVNHQAVNHQAMFVSASDMEAPTRYLGVTSICLQAPTQSKG